MDTETLFTATKWDILKLLEEKSYSPIELAQALGSSLANVSQQLRLLEMAGLVTSKRISNRDKGQPRILYSLAGDLGYVIATAGGLVDKKAVKLSQRNKVVLRIWFLEDVNLRYALEKAFWMVENDLDKIEKLTFAGIENGIPVIEASGIRLPEKLSIGGVYGSVRVRASKTPQGHVLYAKE